MRTITMFIFFVLLASTAKAQTDFDFSCEPSDEEIIAEYGFTETGFLESTTVERMTFIQTLESGDVTLNVSANSTQIRVFVYDNGNPVAGHFGIGLTVIYSTWKNVINNIKASIELHSTN